MKKIVPSLIALAVLALAGCATATFTTGKDFDTSKVSQISKGKSTKAELIAIFGEPHSKTINDDGTERWLWLYTQGKSHAQSYIVSMDVKTEMTGKKLSVLFRGETVETFNYTDGPMTPASMATP